MFQSDLFPAGEQLSPVPLAYAIGTIIVPEVVVEFAIIPIRHGFLLLLCVLVWSIL